MKYFKTPVKISFGGNRLIDANGIPICTSRDLWAAACAINSHAALVELAEKVASGLDGGRERHDRLISEAQAALKMAKGEW